MHTTSTTRRQFAIGLSTAVASLALLIGLDTQPASALLPALDGVCTCAKHRQIDQAVAARKAQMSRDQIARGLLTDDR
jgi:hypothetical protein